MEQSSLVSETVERSHALFLPACRCIGSRSQCFSPRACRSFQALRTLALPVSLHGVHEVGDVLDPTLPLMSSQKSLHLTVGGEETGKWRGRSYSYTNLTRVWCWAHFPLLANTKKNLHPLAHNPCLQGDLLVPRVFTPSLHVCVRGFQAYSCSEMF